MTNKIILKNVDKYKDIKLVTGLNLKKFKTILNIKTANGASTRTFGDKLFVLPKGNAIFKTYDNYNFKETSKHRIINELVCQEICKQIGLNCAKYEPATYCNQTGLVSYNVINNPGDYIATSSNLWRPEFKSFGFYGFYKMLKYYQDNNYVVDVIKELIDIYKIMVFDSIVFQEDRHAGNVHFIVNFDTRRIKLAPLIDNEMAFCTVTFNRFMNNEKIYTKTDILEDSFNIAYVINACKDKLIKQNNYSKNVENIVILAKKNKILKNILINYLNKIDIENAIQNVLKMGYKIPQEYQNFMKTLVQISKQEYMEKLIKQKVNIDELDNHL